MATWKKITLWVLTTLIVIVASCTAMLSHFLDDLCATIIIDQVDSPNGKLKAVLFQIDCGATTDFNSQVAIVPGDLDISERDALPKSFFAADGNHGRAPAGKGGGPEVRLGWDDNHLLELQYSNEARVIRAETQVKDVTIVYHIFP